MIVDFLNEEQNEVLNNLVIDLRKYCEMESFLNIHTHTNLMTISNVISPEIIEYEDNSLCITQGNFVMQLDIANAISNSIFDIQYFGEDDSYFIKCNDVEIYFDFI